jgi:putative DNA primase/helicase
MALVDVAGIDDPRCNDFARERHPPALTDEGNSQRFARDWYFQVRYCDAWRAWMIFDGRQWREDDLRGIEHRAVQTIKGILAEAQFAETDDERKALVKHQSKSEAAPRIRATADLGRRLLSVPPTAFDAVPDLFNFPNGTMDLLTFELRPHRAEDLITKCAAAPYDPDAKSEAFDRSLRDNISETTREFLQRFAGYSLTTATSEDRFAFLCGPGGSGKSTMLEALRQAWGSYATAADFDTFLASRRDAGAASEDRAALHGARLVTAVETRGQKRWDTGLVKKLTGGDPMRARKLFQNSFEFKPVFKLWLAANDRPRVSADDDGFWRRILEVPFLKGRPEERDRDTRIRAEITDPHRSGSAILAWAVEGCRQWRNRGLGVSDDVRLATDQYRRSMDDVGEFLADRCVVEPASNVRALTLRQTYEAWCRESGNQPVHGKAWAQALEQRGLDRTRLHGGQTYWIGVAVKDDDAKDDAAPGWVTDEGDSVKGEPR